MKTTQENKSAASDLVGSMLCIPFADVYVSGCVCNFYHCWNTEQDFNRKTFHLHCVRMSKTTAYLIYHRWYSIANISKWIFIGLECHVILSAFHTKYTSTLFERNKMFCVGSFIRPFVRSPTWFFNGMMFLCGYCKFRRTSRRNYFRAKTHQNQHAQCKQQPDTSLLYDHFENT